MGYQYPLSLRGLLTYAGRVQCFKHCLGANPINFPGGPIPTSKLRVRLGWMLAALLAMLLALVPEAPAYAYGSHCTVSSTPSYHDGFFTPNDYVHGNPEGVSAGSRAARAQSAQINKTAVTSTLRTS